MNVIGNGVAALLRHPGQWRLLCAGVDPRGVEELIRYDPPLQLFERTATVDTEVAGHPVPAGTKIAALLGAAARDPQAFDQPDRLDLRGAATEPGFGPAALLPGPPLARLAVRELRALAPGCPASSSRRPGPPPDFVSAVSAPPGPAAPRLLTARFRGTATTSSGAGTGSGRRREAVTITAHPGGHRGQHVEHGVQQHPVGRACTPVLATMHTIAASPTRPPQRPQPIQPGRPRPVPADGPARVFDLGRAEPGIDGQPGTTSPARASARAGGRPARSARPGCRHGPCTSTRRPRGLIVDRGRGPSASRPRHARCQLVGSAGQHST